MIRTVCLMLPAACKTIYKKAELLANNLCRFTDKKFSTIREEQAAEGERFHSVSVRRTGRRLYCFYLRLHN